MLTDSQKIEIVKRYKEGESGVELSRVFGITPSGILGILRRRKIELRPRGNRRKHTFEQTIFNEVSSPDKAYWLGFLLGDGSVSERSVRVELSEIDVDHLEKLESFMKADCPISRSRKKCVRVSFNSTTLVNSVAKYGLIPNKTDIVVTPNLPANLLSHFYRGILDSDGWVILHRSKRQKDFGEFGFSSANIKFLEEIQKWVSVQLGRKVGYIKERKRKNQRCCQLIFGGNRLFISLFEIFYKDAGTYLDRKFLKATDIKCRILGYIDGRSTRKSHLRDFNGRFRKNEIACS
jgi:intein-encoded DNA endonuclease-like protein